MSEVTPDLVGRGVARLIGSDRSDCVDQLSRLGSRED